MKITKRILVIFLVIVLAFVVVFSYFLDQYNLKIRDNLWLIFVILILLTGVDVINIKSMNEKNAENKIN